MNLRAFAVCFFAVATIAIGAPQFQKFDPPLQVHDGVIVAGPEAPPWLRACCAEWTPWMFQFGEWQSYHSAKWLANSRVDEAQFREFSSKLKEEAKQGAERWRWWSVMATARLKQDQEDFLLVISYPGELDRFPRFSSETNGGLAKLLLRHDETGWKLVDPGTDLAYESAVAKEMLAIDFPDLGIAMNPQPTEPSPESPPPAAPSETAFLTKLLDAYRRADVTGFLSLVEIDESTPQEIKDLLRDSFIYDAKRKATGATIEKLSGEEVTTYQQNGVTFVTTLKPVAKAVVTFDDESNPKLVAVTHLLGLKGGGYRIITAKVQK
jgi:hypothetical protein